jgi:uncharacterized protein YbjT (DUF2867 family)
MNIAITGATGHIGSMLAEELIRNCNPKKIAVFCRDEEKLPPNILERAKVPTNDQLK